jgi:predicted O-linked N-acetylglucosamine transferase (SPINDLY family)
MSFVEDIVANHDTEKFAVTVYSGDMLGLGWVPADGAGVVVPTKDLSNKKLYEKIRADGIDILIDLDGFASFERMELLAMKPAPVIVSWYNAYSSFGIDTIDYLIGDDVVTPPDDDSHYVEEIYRLSGCYVVRNLHHGAPPVNDAAPIADNDYCTFGSFASAHKVHTGCIEAWARVLKEVPGSRLILRNSKMDEHLARFWLGEFAKYGIDTIRVELIGAANHTEFLKTYDRIDIALDCFPWNGGTTTFEAMWQGVPVVCFRGARWVSRVASSIVSAVGHPEWIGQNLDEYVQIAVDLARDPDALQRIRRGLREEMASSVLCDIAGFTKKLEVAFEDMARSKGILA